MKRFEDIIITCIKCENKQGTDKLKELHYKLNDVLYSYKKKYTFQYNIDNLKNELIQLFIDVKKLDVPNTAKPKQDEILSIGRNIVNALKTYVNDNTDVIIAIENSLKYEMANFIKIKQSNISLNHLLNLLDNNKKLFISIKPYDELINNTLNLKQKFDNLVKLQTQLVNMTQKLINNLYLP